MPSAERARRVALGAAKVASCGLLFAAPFYISLYLFISRPHAHIDSSCTGKGTAEVTVGIMETVLKGVNFSFQEWGTAVKNYSEKHGTNPPTEHEAVQQSEEPPCPKSFYRQTMIELQLLCESQPLQPPRFLWVLTPTYALLYVGAHRCGLRKPRPCACRFGEPKERRAPCGPAKGHSTATELGSPCRRECMPSHTNPHTHTHTHAHHTRRNARSLSASTPLTRLRTGGKRIVPPLPSASKPLQRPMRRS